MQAGTNYLRISVLMICKKVVLIEKSLFFSSIIINARREFIRILFSETNVIDDIE